VNREQEEALVACAKAIDKAHHDFIIYGTATMIDLSSIRPQGIPMTKPVDPKNPHDLKIGTKIRISDRDGVVVAFDGATFWLAYTNGTYFENNNGCSLPEAHTEVAIELGFDANKRYFDQSTTASPFVKVIGQPKRYANKDTPLGTKVFDRGWKECTFVGICGSGSMWAKVSKECCNLPSSLWAKAKSLGLDPRCSEYGNFGDSATRLEIIEEPEPKRYLTKTTPIGTKLWINNFEEAIYLGFQGEIAWVKLNRPCALLTASEPAIHASIASLGLDSKANYYGGVIAECAEIREEPKPTEKSMTDIKRPTKDTKPGHKVKVIGQDAIFIAWDDIRGYCWVKRDTNCVELDALSLTGTPGKNATELGFDLSKSYYGAYYPESVELIDEPIVIKSQEEPVVRQEVKQYLTRESKPGTRFMLNGREAILIGVFGHTAYGHTAYSKFVVPDTTRDLSLTGNHNDEYGLAAKALGFDCYERSYASGFDPAWGSNTRFEILEEPKATKSIVGLLVAGTLISSALGVWLKSGTTSVRAEEVATELMSDEIEIEFDEEAVS
jgi:hypothetical protein